AMEEEAMLGAVGRIRAALAVSFSPLRAACSTVPEASAASGSSISSGSSGSLPLNLGEGTRGGGKAAVTAMAGTMAPLRQEYGTAVVGSGGYGSGRVDGMPRGDGTSTCGDSD
ncbi:hypothetical protein Vretifemale_6042, partial [Volvox reticuliferus]